MPTPIHHSMSTADILATERLDSPEKLDEGSAIQHLENYNDNVHGSGDNQANDEPNDLFVASHDQPPADAVSDHCPAEESDAPEEAADPEVKKEVNSPKHVMVSDHDEQKGTAKPKKPIGRRPKNAREQAVKRHEKEREEFKDHVRKEMQKKGLDVSPDDIELPQPKRRRARKGVADLGNEEMDGPDGGLTHIQSEAEAVVVSKKRRHEEISQSANAGGLSNRHASTQKADLREASHHRLRLPQGPVRPEGRRERPLQAGGDEGAAERVAAGCRGVDGQTGNAHHPASRWCLGRRARYG